MVLAVCIVEPIDLIAVDGQAVFCLEVELHPGIDGVDDLANGDAVLLIRWDGVELVRVVAGIKGGVVHGPGNWVRVE
jgi:hypothetical protein